MRIRRSRWLVNLILKKLSTTKKLLVHISAFYVPTAKFQKKSNDWILRKAVTNGQRDEQYNQIWPNLG